MTKIFDKYGMTVDPDEYLDTAIKQSVLSRPLWEKVKDMPGFEKWICQTLEEKGGMAHIVDMLGWLGSPSLSLVQKCLVAVRIEPQDAVKDYSPDGELNVVIAAVRTGNRIWLDWLLKNGADPTWRNHMGQNALAFVFSPVSLYNMTEIAGNGEPLNDNAKIRWAKGQQYCLNALKKFNKGKTWEEQKLSRDLFGTNAKERVKMNMDMIANAQWFKCSNPEVKALINKIMLNYVAAPKKIPSSKPVIKM